MAVDSSHSNAEPEAVSFAAPRGRFIPFGIPFGSATIWFVAESLSRRLSHQARPAFVDAFIVAPSSRNAAAASASAFAVIGQRRAPTGHFFRKVAGQLNGQLLRFVATRNQK